MATPTTSAVPIFVDTSAFIAVLHEPDPNHEHAGRFWVDAQRAGQEFITTNYVLLETFALLQRRLGVEAVRSFETEIVPALSLEWVDQAAHAAGVAAVLTAGRRRLSLVDTVSFEVMGRLGLKSVFAFDEDFSEQGFVCLP